jgi:hypothetical protein
VVGGGALAEEARERLGAGDARHVRGVLAHRLGRGHVAAHDAHSAVVDDDAVGDGVEGLLPDALGRAERVEQARVVERERGHVGQSYQLLPLLGGEAMVLAEADGEEAEALAARAQPRNCEVAHALGAVQRELALGQVAGQSTHLEDGLAALAVEGGGALGELAAHGDDDLQPRGVAEAARRQPGDGALRLGGAGDARGVGAQDAPDGLDHRVERGRALRAPRARSPAAAAVRALRHLALILPESKAKVFYTSPALKSLSSSRPPAPFGGRVVIFFHLTQALHPPDEIRAPKLSVFPRTRGGTHLAEGGRGR